MSKSQSQPQDGIASLNGETDARIIPTEWLDDAPHADIDANETRYYAALATIERTLTTDPDVLAGHAQGRGEQWTIHVLYVRDDGARRIEREYDARVQETADGLDVTPVGLFASLGVDGDHVTPHAAPCTDQIERALRERHDIDVNEEADA